MNSFLRNTISKLHNVSAPVTATRDALAKRLQSVHQTASLLYNRMMENMEYRRQSWKDIVEKEVEEEQRQEEKVPPAAKEQRQDDTVAKIKLVYEGKRLKEFRVTEKFKQIQHKNDHSQHHTTHSNEDKGNFFI